MEFLVKTIDDFIAENKNPEILFWVGCAGSYDPRAKRVSIAFSKILQSAGVEFCILGNQEMCTGDPARRAGNEFVFQMLALQNIETLNAHKIQKIVTTCPHCFNTLKNEYPDFDGHYEVVHSTQFLEELIRKGKLKIIDNPNFAGQKVTYHDSCYLGRVNGVYQIPREIINALKLDLHEMNRCNDHGLCCGAGGAQMFKEDEPGNKRVNVERVEEALNTQAKLVAVNCPYCLTMMTDGLKSKDKQEDVMVFDLAELIVQNNQL